ncbi:MAG: hypothetical protein EB168_10355 [Euryarchaeota archaeon]|nr:hypothetical protein [Euryarchaeota archaeon]
MVGGLADGEDSRLFYDWDSFDEFIEMSSLTSRQVRQIFLGYTSQGASERIAYMEIEAFAVAQDIGAREIADKVVEMCPARFTF